MEIFETSKCSSQNSSSSLCRFWKNKSIPLQIFIIIIIIIIFIINQELQIRRQIYASINRSCS